MRIIPLETAREVPIWQENDVHGFGHGPSEEPPYHGCTGRWSASEGNRSGTCPPIPPRWAVCFLAHITHSVIPAERSECRKSRAARTGRAALDCGPGANAPSRMTPWV